MSKLKFSSTVQTRQDVLKRIFNENPQSNFFPKDLQYMLFCYFTPEEIFSVASFQTNSFFTDENSILWRFLYSRDCSKNSLDPISMSRRMTTFFAEDLSKITNKRIRNILLNNSNITYKNMYQIYYLIKKSSDLKDGCKIFLYAIYNMEIPFFNTNTEILYSLKNVRIFSQPYINNIKTVLNKAIIYENYSIVEFIIKNEENIDMYLQFTLNVLPPDNALKMIDFLFSYKPLKIQDTQFLIKILNSKNITSEHFIHYIDILKPPMRLLQHIFEINPILREQEKNFVEKISYLIKLGVDIHYCNDAIINGLNLFMNNSIKGQTLYRRQDSAPFNHEFLEYILGKSIEIGKPYKRRPIEILLERQATLELLMMTKMEEIRLDSCRDHIEILKIYSSDLEDLEKTKKVLQKYLLLLE